MPISGISISSSYFKFYYDLHVINQINNGHVTPVRVPGACTLNIRLTFEPIPAPRNIQASKTSGIENLGSVRVAIGSVPLWIVKSEEQRDK